MNKGGVRFEERRISSKCKNGLSVVCVDIINNTNTSAASATWKADFDIKQGQGLISEQEGLFEALNSIKRLD